MKPKIAITCQGGGSQTAFTAGVLKAFFENNVQDYFNIVSLTGTSGGCICACLIWYALKKGDPIVWQRVIDFWQDNTAQTYQEILFNDSVIKYLEWVSKGLIPQYNLSPSSSASKKLFSFATQGLRSRFTDLKELLEAHIDFSELEAWGPQAEPPILIIGACNVITGKLHKFISRQETIKIEHLLASACVPNIFPAVAIGDMAYWDGLFSDNPPIRSLIRSNLVGIENIPQEIWVIKINPTTSDKIPVEPDDIADRRNEVEGNVSLFQSLDQIELINELLIRGAFKEEFLAELNIKEPIKIPKSFADDSQENMERNYYIPMIEMSKDLADSLNYESKLDRNPQSIKRLIEDGEKQGKLFLETRLSQMKVNG